MTNNSFKNITTAPYKHKIVLQHVKKFNVAPFVGRSTSVHVYNISVQINSCPVSSPWIQNPINMFQISVHQQAHLQGFNTVISIHKQKYISFCFTSLRIDSHNKDHLIRLINWTMHH